MNHASLFSGIGGFDLAAQWMGWENVFSCEINPFGKKILEYYWPKTTHYDDIKTTDFTIHRGGVDIITGGFPCQPFSLAGKRKGTDDDRHLWPRMLEVIRDVQPIWVVGENVYGLVNWDGGMVFNQVQVDLEALGYEVQSVILPACSVNAPHRRDRVWIVAYRDGLRGGEKHELQQPKIHKQYGERGITTDSNSNGLNRSNSEHEKQSGKGGVNALNDTKQVVAPDTDSPGWEELNTASKPGGENINSRDAMHTNGTSKQGEYIRQKREGEFNGSDSRVRINNWQDFPTQSPICGRDDGIPSGLDGITFPKWRNESIKAYGNAIVPQVALEIFKVIEQLHKL